MIRYSITAKSPAAHLFEITLDIPHPAADGQVLSLPAWIPGSYMIRNFARNIVAIDASCDGVSVALEKTDKQTWRCAPCRGALHIRYEVYAWERSVRGAHFDDSHGYFNGTSVFLRVLGQEQEPCLVDIRPPAGESFSHWRVATSLRAEKAGDFSFGLYRADDYHDLIDHPVEMGTFDVASFELCGTPHHLVVSGNYRTDLERVCADLKSVCRVHTDLFGGLPEMEQYLFLLQAVGDGYGGLEHCDSTSLICKRSDLPVPGASGISDGYRRFLGLCSHEYFHLWNVKRIRPEALIDADLSAEIHTPLLWAFEGITSYYDDLALVRSGLITVESYLELLAQLITRVIRGRGRFLQSIAESSFDAWTRFYLQDENAPNAIVSYYSKGALVALALDLTLRNRTGQEKSLDDLMRLLWERHGVTGKGVREGDIEALAAEVAGSDMDDFFHRYVYGTEDPPLLRLLETVGIGGRYRAAAGSSDKGGYLPEPTQATVPGINIGMQTQQHALGARITAVFSGGAAMEAGLSAGDIIIAMDRIKVSGDNIDTILERIPANETIPVHLFREDVLRAFSLSLKTSVDDTCDLWLMHSAVQDASRDHWLNRHSSG